MESQKPTELSYFPGCSLASSARENKVSLDYLFRHLNYDLVELQDWNCCGSSSAHSIDAALAHDLVSRNLSLAPQGRPLLAACPSCLLRLRSTHLHLRNEGKSRILYEEKWGPRLPTIWSAAIFRWLHKGGLFWLHAQVACCVCGALTFISEMKESLAFFMKKSGAGPSIQNSRSFTISSFLKKWT